MSEHICELTLIDSETWDTTIGEEIVRCRDCKYASYDLRWCYWPINSAELPVRPDGYCAWGERK